MTAQSMFYLPPGKFMTETCQTLKAYGIVCLQNLKISLFRKMVKNEQNFNRSIDIPKVKIK